MSENIYRRARLPLYYPLVFLMNVLLIIALEVLLFYPTSLPLTDSDLSGSVIRNATESGTITWYLVETEADTLQLVPVRKHVFIHSRGKLLTGQIVDIPADTEYMEVTTLAGIGGSTVKIGTEVEPWADEPSEYPIQMRSKYSRTHLGTNGGAAVAGKYFLLGVLLSLLESFLWNKIKE